MWVCGSLTSSDSHGPSAHLYVFAKYIQSVPYTAHLYVFAKYVQSVDGGNLAPLLQRRFFTAPYPLLNIGIENLQKQICSNDGNLAPPQTEQLSMSKRGCGDASSSHRRCLLCRWCKISSIHSMVGCCLEMGHCYCGVGPDEVALRPIHRLRQVTCPLRPVP